MSNKKRKDNQEITEKLEKERISPEIKPEENNEQIIKELQDKLLRVQADSQNYKRRLEEESKNAKKFANEELIEELLPVLDNFERAISLDDNDLNDELSKFLEGFKMIYSSFVNVLNQMELKEIDALEKPFDPVYHQAVMTDKDESKEDGIILEVLQKGYMLKNKVIRPSLVKVNNL